jgi:hypothetical protein
VEAGRPHALRELSEASAGEFVSAGDALTPENTIAWNQTADTVETHAGLMVASFSFLGEVSVKGDS